MSSTRYTKSQPNYRLEQYKRALQDRPVAIASEEYEDDGDEKKRKPIIVITAAKTWQYSISFCFNPNLLIGHV